MTGWGQSIFDIRVYNLLTSYDFGDNLSNRTCNVFRNENDESMIEPSRQLSSIESPVGIKALTISTMSARTTSVELIDSKVVKGLRCG